MKPTTQLRATGLLSFAAVSLILAACAGDSSDDGSEGESVTLSLAMLSSNKPGMDLVVEQFHEENPDITVEPNYYESGDAYTSAVPTQFAAGNGTDLVHVIGGAARPYSLGAFANAGYLSDLSDASWVPQMYEPTKPLYEYEGVVLASDFGVSPLAIMSYNKDFFAENGLAVPASFADLITLCGDISDLGVTPLSWAGASQPVNANNVATMAGNTVFAQDPDWLDARTAGEVTFADSGWRRALEQLQEMIDAGCFSPGVGGVALQDMLTNYGSGEAAMMFTYGGLNGRVLVESPDLNIGMFPFPADDPSDTRITVQSAGGLGIWTESDHAEQANTFLEFLSRDDVSAVFSDNNQLISSAQATSGDLPGVYQELEPFFSGEGLIISDVTALWPNTQMNDQAGASIQGLFTDQKTIDDVLADMDAAFEGS